MYIRVDGYEEPITVRMPVGREWAAWYIDRLPTGRPRQWKYQAMYHDSPSGKPYPTLGQAKAHVLREGRDED